jgi:predicted MFS family arabinose efflux permease
VTPIPPAKRRFLLLTLRQSIPQTFFVYGAPYYAQARFGWGPDQIALVVMLSGFFVAIGSYAGGQVAHRTYPERAMRMGIGGAIVGALLGLVATGRAGVPALALSTVVVSFMVATVWPAIEAALVSGEPPESVQNLVGWFNITWSFGSAVAFLAVTPLLRVFGLHTIFVLPALFFLANLLSLRRMAPARPVPASARDVAPHGEAAARPAVNLTERQRAGYRRLGWIANPTAYVAIMVIVTYNPAIRTRLGLSFAAASVWCSLWFYVRMAAFDMLRRWTWWHYRWGFLCFTFAMAMASFAAFVLAPSLPVLLAAQVVFGLSMGLIYQSSLFYSMAGSKAQGAHGGFHECFIGLGTMTGPLLAYAGAHLAPGVPALPIGLVLALMSVALAALLGVGLQVLRPAARCAAGAGLS